jgi:hypothetical protein
MYLCRFKFTLPVIRLHGKLWQSAAVDPHKVTTDFTDNTDVSIREICVIRGSLVAATSDG